jgi:hypothetical protein
MENYFAWSKIPRSDWVTHCMQYTKGKAHSVLMGAVNRLGAFPSWDELMKLYDTACMGAVIVGFEAKLLVAEFRFIKECKEPVTAATFNAMYQEFEDHVNRSKFSEEDKCFLLYAALPPSNRPQLRYLNQMTDGMAQVEFSELAPMKFRMYDMLPAILEAIIQGKAALAKPAEAWGSGVKRQKAEDNPQQPRYNHPAGNSNVSQAVPPSLQNRAAHRVVTSISVRHAMSRGTMLRGATRGLTCTRMESCFSFLGIMTQTTLATGARKLLYQG